ncbi:peptidase M15 [Pasteurellaceae bacterium RH1A]|nr:peptidase M15 [Pasteurellaceae bacterium RH1A]
MQNFTNILTGKSREHLVALPNALSPNHFLHPLAAKAFLALQTAAHKAGFNLQPASSFRDFERQKAIWNAKFRCERKVHDDWNQALDLSCLDDWAKAQAILRWSAMPGASRHHWGTEIDVFDPDLLPQGQSLQLEPWEYQANGYFAELANWLVENLTYFDFYLPFSERCSKKIGLEPWHISYFYLAENYASQFKPEILLSAWENEDVAGKACLEQHLDQIFKDYIL